MEKNHATIKVDTSENWAKAKNYIPDIFTIIVYQDEDNTPRIKIGDGKTTVNNLPFLVKEKEVIDSILLL